MSYPGFSSVILDFLFEHMSARYHASEWARLLNVDILDNDGGFELDKKYFLTEFVNRVSQCTIGKCP